jgi:hypothetical protein
MRLTLRTLLAYLDDTLPPAEARQIGLKVAENPAAQELIDRIKRVTRRRGLATPPTGNEGSPSDPNTVADYLSDAIPPDQVAEFEKSCLESDVHLAEVAACHQILTLVLSEQVRVPPTARKRMYQLVKGREAIPDRKPGKTIPVGGVLEVERAADADDTDAPFLLGMPAYSRSDSWPRTAARLGTLALVLVAFGVALWMAIPPSARPRPDEPPGREFAAVIPPPRPVQVPSGGTETPKPEIVQEPMIPQPEDTTPREELPPPRLPGEPLPGAIAQANPDQELVPKDLPPRPDRVQIGRLEKPQAVVVRTSPQAEGWFRVPPDDPGVITADRLVALPGYKSVLRFDTGVAVDLWGNLPELLPLPVLETSVTPHLPYDGFHADLTVHVGRIYLTTSLPKGAHVRLRFRDQVWDLSLADDKTEVAVEVVHTLVPGPQSEPPRTTVGLAVLTGQATLKPSRYKEPVVLPQGGDAIWDSKAGPPVVWPDPDEGARKQLMAYLSKYQAYPDSGRAKPALEALDDFARKLADGRRLRAAFDEALQDSPPPSAKEIAKVVAAARIAVLVFAALGDLPGLADAISDPGRQLLRQTAIEGLRAALAREPELAEPFRQTLVDKLQVEDDQADAAMRLLRGFTEKEMADPDTVDRLVGGLSSSTVCVRELSFQYLLAYIDPAEKVNEPLLRYDAGARPEAREPVVQAWRKKAEELKKKLTEPPPEPEKK